MSRYTRKTTDCYDVEGNYGAGEGWECVTAAATYKEAKQHLKEYRENEPGVAFRVRKYREPITQDAPRCHFCAELGTMCASCLTEAQGLDVSDEPTPPIPADSNLAQLMNRLDVWLLNPKT